MRERERERQIFSELHFLVVDQPKGDNYWFTLSIVLMSDN